MDKETNKHLKEIANMGIMQSGINQQNIKLHEEHVNFRREIIRDLFVMTLWMSLLTLSIILFFILAYFNGI